MKEHFIKIIDTSDLNEVDKTAQWIRRFLLSNEGEYCISITEVELHSSASSAIEEDFA